VSRFFLECNLRQIFHSFAIINKVKTSLFLLLDEIIVISLTIE